MKRIITFATFLLSLQIVNAHSLTATFFANGKTSNSYLSKILPDTTLTMPVSAYTSSIFKQRLDSIQKDVPLDYNEYVQAYIDIYTRHKDEMGHVMGLSKYYFPIYEKIFHESGIPTEIKYLSIVESKLDPNAVSRVGATGPWQFMATTAKIYGLNMDSYIDERRDPIQASYAAAAYLKDAYQEFGDWLLAIASYNCGKSSVERAIEKAGAMDFWSIRQYLPPETRSYVPAFIAMSYVMNYGGKHSIVADNWRFSARTDTVMVDKMIDLNNVARALSVNISDLALLNPAYKRQIINGTTTLPRRLIIPHTEQRNFTALYNVLNGLAAPVALQPQVAPAQVVTAAYVPAAKSADKNPDYHIIKEGETLENIAADYGLDVREIRAWNRMQSNKVIAGQKLRLNPFAKASKG
ncbi:lytic transglycosylase domain-containing protein [Mucilaginibacter sp. UR6-11]|uniref:lytic transglycosylase domain-containing protein n=1 Tax=Mucilaginibacter sp. UR6-11 TaxID=1435644 RepID=UPI001E33477C|nr:lytic transglycosylase domain-containing protein [Mucilaginibacter sp. UR6-11]MCC8425221.1 transglycosylase SLT domain-containing protein [Mucilaginibacter sp. UR6-11]